MWCSAFHSILKALCDLKSYALISASPHLIQHVNNFKTCTYLNSHSGRSVIEWCLGRIGGLRYRVQRASRCPSIEVFSYGMMSIHLLLETLHIQ